MTKKKEPEPVVPQPALDPKTMTREQLNWKRQALVEHLDVLLESLGHAVSEYENMRESFELNPPKRKELEDAIKTMDEEVEKAKKELADLNRV